jgi:hypothetical protein
VAFDGTNYMVVYQHDHSATQQPDTLDSVRISTSGNILSTAVVVSDFSSFATNGSNLAMASGGTDYLLVFNRAGPLGPELSGVLIATLNGQHSSAEFPIVGASTGISSNPAIAYDGANFLIVWDNRGTNPGLYAERVSTAAQIMDPLPILVADESVSQPGRGCCGDLNPAVAFDGVNYLVAYSDPRNEVSDASSATISAARISKNGALLDGSSSASGIKVTNAKGVTNDHVTAIFFSGEYWLFWTSKSIALYGARLSTSGAITSPGADGFPVQQVSAPYPAAAANSTSALLLYRYRPSSVDPFALGGLPIYPSH